MDKLQYSYKYQIYSDSYFYMSLSAFTATAREAVFVSGVPGSGLGRGCGSV
jgi:hypothetical protein